jgi:hypothetical protein
LVLDNVDGLSSLAASLSKVVELLEGWIETAATNGVCWGTRSALVSILSHFPELKSMLDLTEDQVDALWSWVRIASDSLASHVPPSVTRALLTTPGSGSGGSLCP